MVKRTRPWPGWAAVVDEELVRAGGALAWKRLRSLVVARYNASDGVATSEPGLRSAASPGDLALASIPECYTSHRDQFVRLPSAMGTAAAGSASANRWEGWATACRVELQRARGVLAWRQLQELLVARYCAANGLTSVMVDLQSLRRHALAQLPEEYLSQEDRFVRLPFHESAADVVPPQKRGASCFLGEPAVSAVPPEREAELASSSMPASIASKLCLQITACGDEATFAQQLSSAASKLVVVDFSATWCGACQRIRPDLHDLAAEMPEVVFLEVDVDTNAGLANSFGVKSMPTFLFFRNSTCVGRCESDDPDELSVQILMNM